MRTSPPDTHPFQLARSYCQLAQASALVHPQHFLAQAWWQHLDQLGIVCIALVRITDHIKVGNPGKALPDTFHDPAIGEKVHLPLKCSRIEVERHLAVALVRLDERWLAGNGGVDHAGNPFAGQQCEHVRAIHTRTDERRHLDHLL